MYTAERSGVKLVQVAVSVLVSSGQDVGGVESNIKRLSQERLETNLLASWVRKKAAIDDRGGGRELRKSKSENEEKTRGRKEDGGLSERMVTVPFLSVTEETLGNGRSVGDPVATCTA